MTGPEHEDEFEAYLTRRLPIHQRLSALERLEPPQELDRIIITKARQAIQGPSPVRIFRAPKWALPVGLAATLVISFTILLNLGAHAVKHRDQPVLMTNITPNPPSVLAAPVPQAPEPAAPRQAVPSESTATVDSTNQHVPPPSPPPLPGAGSWFKRIERLRAAGKTTEAEQEFRRFRDAYPNYEPPAEPPAAHAPTK